MNTKQLFLIAALALSAATTLPADQVLPKVADPLQPVTLKQAELSGEIGRRISDLIYKHYRVLDLDRGFLNPFRQRPPAKGSRYIGVGKLIDAGSLFATYFRIADLAKAVDDELMSDSFTQ